MRRIIVSVALFFAGSVTFAQSYGRLDFSIQNGLGQAVPNVNVTVYTQSACGASAGSAATLYPTANGGTPLSNPVQTNGLGKAFAYVVPGCVTVTYSSPQIQTQTYPDQNVTVGDGGISIPVTIQDGGTGATTAQGAATNIVNGNSIAPKSVNTILKADQFAGADISIKINACITAVIAQGGGVCDARALYGDYTLSEEINLGTTAQVLAGDSVDLLLPNTGVWTWSGITDGTSCGIKQFSSTRLIGSAAAAQGANLILYAAPGVNMDSLYCTDPGLGDGFGSYIRAEGFSAENGESTAQFANGLMDVFGLVDQSDVNHIDALNVYGDSWHINAICCGTSFSHISALSQPTNGGIPLRIGNSDVVQNATVSNGSPTVTTSGALGCAFSPGDVGKTVTGTGIPNSTTMLTWNNCRSITMSHNATSDETETVGIYGADTPNIPMSAISISDSTANYPGLGEPNVLISKNDYIGPILFSNLYMEPDSSNTTASIYQDIYAFGITWLNTEDISNVMGKYTIESHAGLSNAYYGEGPWQVIGMKTSYGINDVTAGKIIPPIGGNSTESILPLYLSQGYPQAPITGPTFVSGPNLIPNPNFSTGSSTVGADWSATCLSGWTCTFLRDNSTVPNSNFTYAQKITQSGGSVTDGAQLQSNQSPASSFSVSTGQEYIVSFWEKSDGSNIAFIPLISSASTYLSFYCVPTPGSVVATATWTFYSGLCQSTATASDATLYINTSGVAGAVWVTGVNVSVLNSPMFPNFSNASVLPVNGSAAIEVQGSDGTGTSGNCAKYAADGSLTDAGAPCGSGGGMVYPGAGIGVSTGSAWATSLTEFGSAVGIGTTTDPGTTAEVPMVADGSHGEKPSASGALGTGAFVPSLSLLKGTYTDGDWCSYTASGTLLNCNNAVPQAALSLIKGTYVDGDLCSYTASGTLLNCNTAPGGTGTVTDGSGTTTPLQFPESTSSAHVLQYRTPTQALGDMGAAPAVTNDTLETSSFTAACNQPPYDVSNAGAQTITAPAVPATGNCIIVIKNKGAGTWTFTGSSNVYDLESATPGTLVSSATITTNQSRGITADGTNFWMSASAPTSVLTGITAVVNGGTGTGSTLTGLMRGSASTMTAAELSGDATTSGSNAVTVIKVNGGSVPASAAVLGTNSGSQPVAATSHQIQLPSACVDTSGSGTAQTCATSPTFTPAYPDCVNLTTATTNSGAGLTLNVNSSSAISVAIPGSSGYTTTLTASIIPANTVMKACLNSAGTAWDVQQTGTAAGGGVTGGSVTVSSATQGSTSCSSTSTATDTGLTTSGAFSRVVVSYTSDPSSLTGWGSNGGMVFQAWPTSANTATWRVCNQSTSSITYSTITFGLGAN